MKSSNLRNIDISQQKGIWSTTPSNELKLNRAFLESSLVFLVFSVQGSGHFQVCVCVSESKWRMAGCNMSFLCLRAMHG